MWAIPTDEELAREHREQDTADADALAYVEPLLDRGMTPAEAAARVEADASLSASARRAATMYLIRNDLRPRAD